MHGCQAKPKTPTIQEKVCPQCGQPVVPAAPVPEEIKPILCEECGTEIPAGMDACPNCGCPVPAKEEVVDEAPQKVEVTAVNLPKMNQNTKKYIIIAAAAVLALIVALFIGKNAKEQKLAKEAAQRSENYISTLETASYTMLLGAIEAEEAGNLIKSVWYNAIYEERDSKTDKFTSLLNRDRVNFAEHNVNKWQKSFLQFVCFFISTCEIKSSNVANFFWRNI